MSLRRELYERCGGTIMNKQRLLLIMSATALARRARRLDPDRPGRGERARTGRAPCEEGRLRGERGQAQRPQILGQPDARPDPGRRPERQARRRLSAQSARGTRRAMAPGPPGVSGYQRVQENITVPDGNATPDFGVSCPGGRSVLGGGYSFRRNHTDAAGRVRVAPGLGLHAGSSRSATRPAERSP